MLAGAGDIAWGGDTDEATAKLLDQINPDVVFTTGDNAYETGAIAEFTTRYEPTWGRHKARTRPAPGNHEYESAGAAGYFEYFGAAAGTPGKGWYSYDIGAWHIIVLNTNGPGACSTIPCSAGSEQELWLRQDLAATTASCVAAFMHHPRFSAGVNHGDSSGLRPVWQALYDYRADLVIASHDHNYQRLARMDPAGNLDPVAGLRSFVVGTGGKSPLYALTTRAGVEVANAQTHGVLKLTLHTGGYDWEFVPVAGSTFTDRGSDVCGPGAPAPPPPPPPPPPSPPPPPPATTTATFAPAADARVYEGSPTSNYGMSYLRTDGGSDPDADTYIRFVVTGVAGVPQTATLRLYATSGTSDGPAVFASDPLWDEMSLTWANRPLRFGSGVADKASISSSAWASFDVTPLVSGNGTYGFVLAQTSTDGVYFSSREAASQRPELVVTYG